MTLNRWLRGIVPICLSLFLFLTACAPQDNSPYAQAQQDSTRRGAPTAVVKESAKGATFNQFFPTSTGTYQVIPAQEKKGFAEYKLNQDGNTVAMLSISDTLNLPTAAQKYQNSTFSVAGFPAVDQGTTGTGLLVGDRYQVKVLSRDPAFTQEDRLAWLQKFDLRGLAKLAPAAAAKSVKGEVKGAIAPSVGTSTANTPATGIDPILAPGRTVNPQPAT